MIMQQHMLVSNSVIIHLHLKIFCAEEYLKQLQAPSYSAFYIAYNGPYPSRWHWRLEAEIL